MDLVYFNEELSERAPHVMGALSLASGEGWAGLPDLVAALRRGEAVTIRQASETELRRAEDFVALYELGQQLAVRLHSLLDGKPEATTAAVTSLRDAFESPAFENPKVPTDLLDKVRG